MGVMRLSVVMGCLFPVLFAGMSTRGQEVSPRALWASGPLEVTAVFDESVAQGELERFLGETISYELPAATGSARLPRKLRVAGARLEDGGRTLVLATDPHPRVTEYRLGVSGGRSLSYRLNGVQAEWSEPDDPPESPRRVLWLPELSFAGAAQAVPGSAPHRALDRDLARPGRLVLTTQLRLPPGEGTLEIRANGSIEDALLGDAAADPLDPEAKAPRRSVDLGAEPRADLLFCSITLKTGMNAPGLRVSWKPAGQAESRPVDRTACLLPWAPAAAMPGVAAANSPNLGGGDAARGRRIFTSDQAQCAKCHVRDGQGGKVGPDLTVLRVKDPAWIYASIATPSAEIVPEFTTYTVALKDGQVHAGVVRAIDARVIRVTDSNAKSVDVAREQILRIQPSSTSIMPVGLAAALGAEAVRDLVAFLMSEPEPARSR